MPIPNNSHFSAHLPDIQPTEPSVSGIKIDGVGISSVVIPVSFTGKNGIEQHTTAELRLVIDLPADTKGIHMSRMSECLYNHLDEKRLFGAGELQDLTESLLNHAGSDHTLKASVNLSAMYFIEIESPATKIKSIAPIQVMLTSTAERMKGHKHIHFESYVGVGVNGKTCCPCSREISEYNSETGTGKGAHSQRGLITIKTRVKPGQFVWFEDLFEVAGNSFSSPVYGLLKRADEKAVTEGAYANPKFVEDVIRDVAFYLDQLTTIQSYEVQVENFESIHFHNAFAKLSRSL